MHELSIAKSIKEIVEEEIEKQGEIKTVERIKLVIGGMHAVVPEALMFNFKILTKGSVLEGAELEIREIPVQGECGNCGAAFEMTTHFFICTSCGSTDITINGGDEFYIESIIGRDNGD
jgi:hydrogenase nickel incorporation protein HypA/HybF